MKAEIRPFRDEDIPAACEMWNAAMKGSYVRAALSPEELRRLTLGNECFDGALRRAQDAVVPSLSRGDGEASFTAEEGRRPVGCVLSFFSRPYENDMFWHFAVAGWIGAIVVDEGSRRRGIGRALIGAAEEVHRRKGRLLLLFGGGEGMQCIVAGVEDNRPDLEGFLRSAGYEPVRRTCWIDVDLAAYSEPGPVRRKRRRLTSEGVDVRLAKPEDEEELSRYLSEEATKGWESRLESWKRSPSDWVVAVGRQGGGPAIVGAIWGLHARRGGRAGYGNIVTLPAHRSRGIGSVMLATAMAECRRRGARSMPLWTRPATHERFYEKLGFEVAVNLDVYGKVLKQDLLSQEWIGRFWG